jgi:hypothetical protein
MVQPMRQRKSRVGYHLARVRLWLQSSRMGAKCVHRMLRNQDKAC